MMLSKVQSFPKGKTTFSNIFLYSNKRALVFEFQFFCRKYQGSFEFVECAAPFEDLQLFFFLTLKGSKRLK